jgi:hypothetical protein
MPILISWCVKKYRCENAGGKGEIGEWGTDIGKLGNWIIEGRVCLGCFAVGLRVRFLA